MLADPAANARASVTLLKDPIRLSGRLSFMAGIALGCYCSSGWRMVRAFCEDRLVRYRSTNNVLAVSNSKAAGSRSAGKVYVAASSVLSRAPSSRGDNQKAFCRARRAASVFVAGANHTVAADFPTGLDHDADWAGLVSRWIGGAVCAEGGAVCAEGRADRGEPAIRGDKPDRRLHRGCHWCAACFLDRSGWSLERAIGVE
jgi:hypothetical protein